MCEPHEIEISATFWTSRTSVSPRQTSSRGFAFKLGFACATVAGPPLVAMTAAGPLWSWLAWGGFFTMLTMLVRSLHLPRPPLIMNSETSSHA